MDYGVAVLLFFSKLGDGSTYMTGQTLHINGGDIVNC